MIKNVMSTGKYMSVTTSNSSTYVNNYSGAIGVGNLRYNTSNQNMEVFDGSNWQMINMGHANIGLNSEAEGLLDWAREERNKQWKIQAMAKDHPAVKNALDAVQRAKEQLELVYNLSKEDYNNEVGEVQTSP